MMRLLFVLWVLLPFSAFAQFASFKEGSYVLYGNPKVSHHAMLRLAGSSKLLVKDATGEKTTFTPEKILSFSIGQRKYVTAGNFTIGSSVSSGAIEVDNAFVEQLDSGQVVLARYQLQRSSPMTTSRSGIPVGGGSTTQDIYLLRTPPSLDFIPVPFNMLGGGKEFRESLQRYLSSRTDLAALVDSKQIKNNDLPALIHALNTGNPYDPSVSSGH